MAEEKVTLIADFDYLWTVEDSYDAIRKKKIKSVRKQEEWRRKWNYRKLLVFESEETAQQFVIDRKIRQIVEAKETARDLERKLKALRNKFQKAKEGQ